MNYDIFISYKHEDEYGNLTQDYSMAEDLYLRLTAMKYSVFWAAKSLEKRGTSQFKREIDEARESAKILIVVLSDVKYATSRWVQYEWDSFYSDYLSEKRAEPNLYTLTSCQVDIRNLPSTLRMSQHFRYPDEMERLCRYVRNALPLQDTDSYPNPPQEKRVSILSGKQVTTNDIQQAITLDKLVYDEIYHVDENVCEEWFKTNPDIYVMAKDIKTNQIIAYVNIAPVTEECYDMIRQGDFIDVKMTADMLLSYDMPGPYSLYFSSIVIHPDYQNSEVFMEILNAIIDKIISLGRQEVFIHKMLADAVTSNGLKFCKLFGMQKVNTSNHNSSLYEISMIPPKFRILSKKCKQLYDYYTQKYEEAPYLFAYIKR